MLSNVLRTGLLLTTSLVLLSCGKTENDMPATWKDNALADDLRVLALQKTYFGHQSVGINIVDGVRELASLHPEVPFTVVDPAAARTADGPFFAESLIGKNSDPGSKCSAYQDVLAQFQSGSLDIALMKFCYVDVKATTDVDSMFNRYTQGIEEVKRRSPGTTFVHVTIPTTRRTSPMKQFLKKILGKVDEWDVAATKRYEYNAKLRSKYGSEPLFDLEAIESKRPDGEAIEFEYQGKRATSLYDAYTDDGGHLNGYGRKVVARELIRYLAQVARQRTTSL